MDKHTATCKTISGKEQIVTYECGTYCGFVHVLAIKFSLLSTSLT